MIGFHTRKIRYFRLNEIYYIIFIQYTYLINNLSFYFRYTYHRIIVLTIFTVERTIY